jgi:hypothetical protein
MLPGGKVGGRLVELATRKRCLYTQELRYTFGSDPHIIALCLSRYLFLCGNSIQPAQSAAARQDNRSVQITCLINSVHV